MHNYRAPGLGALRATFMPSLTVSARLSEEVPCWYYRTLGDQSIHMVDLRQAIDAAKGETRMTQIGRLDPADHQRLDQFHGRQIGDGVNDRPAASPRAR
jgi:hypothetical protein